MNAPGRTGAAVLRIYDPARIEQALGIAPRNRT
jgi:hypothetical protein